MGKIKSKKPTLTVDDRIQMCALKHSEIYDRTRNNPKFKYFLEWLDNNANTFLREINRTVKSKYARYNRGQVVMVRFGIGIDTELSGDHLAIVLTKNDNPNSGSITLIPLTSTKKANHISAGYHIWDKLLEQIDIHKSKIRKRAKQLNEEFPPTLAEFSQVVKESRLILELCGLPKLVINKAHEEIINETKKDNFVYKFCEIIENSIFSRIKDVKETEDIIEAKRSLIDKTKKC